MFSLFTDGVVGSGEVEAFARTLCVTSARCRRRLCSSRFSLRVKPGPELLLQLGKGQCSGLRAARCIL